MPGLVLNVSQDQIADASSPLYDSFSWNSITVGGVTWFGKVEIKRAKRKYKWDVKDGAGIEGATQTYRGKRPEPFNIRFYVWTDLMWTNWKAFSNTFQYSGVKGLLTPVDCYHPALAAAGISQVVCDELGILEQVSDDLMFAVDVTVREYFPPLKLNATKTPPGAASTNPLNIPGLGPSAAVSALQLQLSPLRVTAASLGTPGGLP